MPAEVGHHEEQVAEFFFDLVGVAADFGDKFSGFLGDLVQDMGGVGPVKADAGGAFLQFDRAQERGKADGNPVQRTALCLGRAFGGLDGLPVDRLLFGRLVAAFGAKDVGMARDHLVRHLVGHVVEVEQAPFGGDLGVEDGLEQQVAQFSLQLVPGLALDGIGDLVGLFDGIGRDRREILFYIPGAARLGVTQATHDFQQAFDSAIGVVDQGVIGHCGNVFSGVR